MLHMPRKDESLWNKEVARRLFTSSLAETDPELHVILGRELARQQDTIELIASENLASCATLEASGSILTNKYAEGYPNRRYYGGCQYVDEVERLAIARAKALFGCAFVNVQPHSGAQANHCVLLALLKPGDTILGMSLAAGGHLTHGAKPNLSGKWFRSFGYGVHPRSGRIDAQEVEDLAREHRPALIIAGGSSYARHIDFARFRDIADSVGAFLQVDMAHFAGLVAGGVYPSPIPHAHVVTTTTHKTLRAARGGMIMCQSAELARKINAALFPGLQGGPLLHAIAGKAVGLREALRPEFRTYAEQVVKTAQALAEELLECRLDLVSGGTDSHLVLLDLRRLGLTGLQAEKSLDRAGLTCNKNGIPFDSEKPTVTSGIRLGTPVGVSRGFGCVEFRRIARMINRVLRSLQSSGTDCPDVESQVRAQVSALCKGFPVYSGYDSRTNASTV